MHPIETKTRKGLLQYLANTAVANDENGIGNLLDLFNPDPDRIAMGKKFNDVLGYNPITQFDFDDILNLVDKIKLNDADIQLAEELTRKNQLIAKRAMAIFEENRTKYFKDCLAEAGMEILSRDNGEAFSNLLIGHVFDALDEEEDVDDEGVASELDEDDGDESFPGASDDDPEDFGLGEEDDD